MICSDNNITIKAPNYEMLWVADFIPITFFISSCHTTEPEKQKLEIAFEDASCTEAWLNVKGETGSQIILNRDGKEVQRFTLTASPQTVYDDSLLPNKSYEYQLIKNGEASTKTTITTLDTKSHNFTWDSYLFGGNAGSCTLNDVAIIDENDIWAVGEIYIADNSENGNTLYNAIHWNGNQWELKHIVFSVRTLYPDSGGDTIGITPIKSVFAFGSNDIWLAAGTVQHWDGMQWKQYRGEYAGFANKIWGNNSSDLYFVNGNGTLIHYQNGQWNKIETGTKLDLYDIYGSFSDKTNQPEVLAVASTFSGSLILKITGSNVTQIPVGVNKWNTTRIWFEQNRAYYISGNALPLSYKHNLSDSLWSSYSYVTPNPVTAINGAGVNDVFAATAFGELIHFNGKNWNTYYQVKISNGAYKAIKINDNLVIAVGEIGQQAVITVGRR
jgi:hypothetical protein